MSRHATATKVEKGIWRTPKGDLFVRVKSAPRGITDGREAVANVATLEEGRFLVTEAHRLRAQGLDVQEAWSGRATSLQPRGRSIEELASDYLHFCRELVELSDHTTPARRNGQTSSMRPTTLSVKEGWFRREILPNFGSLPLSNLTAKLVLKWVLSMAERGFSEATQTSVLAELRTLVNFAAESERPRDFPWRSVVPITARQTKKPKPDPDKWGGSRLSLPPALSMGDAVRIAYSMEPAESIGVLLEYLMAMRRGEVVGIRLRDIAWTNGHLHLSVNCTRNVSTGKFQDWAKSVAGYRTLTAPTLLAPFIIEYCVRYHSWDPRQGDPDRPEAFLQVSPSGRRPDELHLREDPVRWLQRYERAVELCELSPSHVGYALKPHFLRKSNCSYLMSARELSVAFIESGRNREIIDDPALMALGVSITGQRITEWMGHENDGDRDLHLPQVTMSSYSLPLSDETSTIPKFIDVWIRVELGTDWCFHLAPPSESDLLPVVAHDDPNWFTLKRAAAQLGIPRSTMENHARRLFAGESKKRRAWITHPDYHDLSRLPGFGHPQVILSRGELDAISTGQFTAT